MAELKLEATQALLHVGARSSRITTSDGRAVGLALGYAAVPATLFGGQVPTALELENAIAAVEDEVMPAVRQLADVAELVTVAPELCALVAPFAGPDGELALGRIEWLFDEIARAALGGPAARSPFALTPASAATLLIVRELMHHGGMRTLRCRP